VRRVEINYSRAVQCYQQAADKGHAEAQYHFGFCLEHGIGLPINLCQAAHYYRLSADQGHAGGLRSYARFLHYGLGIDQDLEDAARYYEMAVNASVSMFEQSHFRCLRGLHRVSLSYIQMFSGFSIPRL
jgi:TPR repeat protein